MKYAFIIVLTFVAIACFAQDRTDFPYWLEGTWVIESETGESYEEWVLFNDSLMKGKTYRYFLQDTIVFDTMSIKLVGGNVVFEMAANIRNQRVKAGFVLLKPTDDLWKFENPITDSPHNIHYWKLESDRVYVWTETMDLENACMDFIMIRHR
ncbi:MAG: hypothetical protein JXR36_17370 [Bacteroidales bacterium]|nr:hypothetical protein [Bacteroidales bacterium]